VASQYRTGPHGARAAGGVGIAIVPEGVAGANSDIAVREIEVM
jgi:hypothetical protein